MSKEFEIEGIKAIDRLRKWKQPTHTYIKHFDDKHVEMSNWSFNMLTECSLGPSNGFVGMMWKRQAHSVITDETIWYLCWYECNEAEPSLLVEKSKKILITEVLNLIRGQPKWDEISF